MVRTAPAFRIWKVASFILLLQGTLAGRTLSFFNLEVPLPAGTAIRDDGPHTVGNVFTVASQNLVVNQLGALDVSGDGFRGPVQVGLWTGNGTTLLGTVTVDTMDLLKGGYRYHSLSAPVTLSAGGSYLIGARVGSGIEPYYDALPKDFVSANPAILLGDARHAGGNIFTAPTNTDGFLARWAPANALFTANRPPLSNGYSTTIKPNSTWGTWDGWGVSLCWWANVFGSRDDLADLAFTTRYTVLDTFPLPGLGLNIARYNAGGCGSNSIGGTIMQVSPNLPVFRQIQGYWLDENSTNPASSSWDWSADANQRAMLLKAKSRGANLLELFSNSPMWWLCYNHNPSGASTGSNDNLPAGNYDQHALYLASVAKYASDNWGVTFNSVEAFNEPDAHWWTATGTQEGCHFSPNAQAAVIGYLRHELDERGLATVQVAASDENTYDSALATWGDFNSTARAQVSRVNTHGYQYLRGHRDLLSANVSGKSLWDSEYGDSDGSGLSLARNLSLDFRCLHPTGWCYWQVLDNGGWGLIQANPSRNWIGPANRKLFVLAQYTRHIRPGMIIMDSGEANTVAAYDPEKRKLVLVTANYGVAQWVTYNLNNFPSATGPVERWITVTESGPSYQGGKNISVKRRRFKAWFPANAVQTFEIQNVDLHPNS